MGANLDPTQLPDSENVNQGAPVIRSDGVVLNGNGRAMAIRRAQATGRADGYRNAILENAERLGLNKDEIAAMKNPVLVREVTDELTKAGVRRVRNALFTAAFGDSSTLANLAETSETEGNVVKSITNALTATAGKFARARAIAQRDNLPGHKRDPKKILQFMQSIADAAVTHATESGGMFGGTPKSFSLAKAIANARQQIEGDDLTQEMLQHEPTFNKIATRMHKRLQTHKDEQLKNFVDRQLENAKNGDEQALRTLNRLKGDPTETAEENSNQNAESQQEPPQVKRYRKGSKTTNGDTDAQAQIDGMLKHNYSDEQLDAEQDDDELVDPPESKSEKFSRVGSKGKLENFLSDDELTPVQKAIQAFCAKMGVPVVFFRSDSDIQGAYQNGVAYINVNSKFFITNRGIGSPPTIRNFSTGR